MKYIRRYYLGPLPCIFGWHCWSKPTATNRATLSGERRDDGSWETETVSGKEVVTQNCRWCPRHRDREDLTFEDCWNYPWDEVDEDASRF